MTARTSLTSHDVSIRLHFPIVLNSARENKEPFNFA